MKGQKVSPWIVRLMGDQTRYKDNRGREVCHGVATVRSLQWPGAFTFYFQERYISIYVGNGHKYEEVSYFPLHPPKVMADPTEYESFHEPNPKNEPKAKAEQPVAAEEE